MNHIIAEAGQGKNKVKKLMHVEVSSNKLDSQNALSALFLPGKGSLGNSKERCSTRYTLKSLMKHLKMIRVAPSLHDACQPQIEQSDTEHV